MKDLVRYAKVPGLQYNIRLADRRLTDTVYEKMELDYLETQTGAPYVCFIPFLKLLIKSKVVLLLADIGEEIMKQAKSCTYIIWIAALWICGIRKGFCNWSRQCTALQTTKLEAAIPCFPLLQCCEEGASRPPWSALSLEEEPLPPFYHSWWNPYRLDRIHLR